MLSRKILNAQKAILSIFSKHEISEHSQMPTENKIFLATTGRVPTVVAAGSRAKEGKSKGK